MNQKIRHEILERGPMTFARFMELALGEYYERQAEIGKRGDFYTSVSVGPVFAELLGCQFEEWTRDFPAIQIVETGGHQGQFARDLLHWWKQWRPKTFSKVQYILVEPSSIRRGWQEKSLAEFSSQAVWRSEFPETVTGIIFSNELLDAMPVHRLFWSASEKRWLEWHVVVDDENFVWQRGELSKVGTSRCDVPPASSGRPEISTDRITSPDIPDDLAAVLPDGFIFETSPAAVRWWNCAAKALSAGKIIAFDYGLTAEEFFQPERSRGTLRAYKNHRVSDDLLANPGEQDLTAHVNFSAIQASGESAGLQTEGLFEQSTFLTRIFQKTVEATGSFTTWDESRIKQFQTLSHPGHLGRFRVLVQSAKSAPGTC